MNTYNFNNIIEEIEALQLPNIGIKHFAKFIIVVYYLDEWHRNYSITIIYPDHFYICFHQNISNPTLIDDNLADYIATNENRVLHSFKPIPELKNEIINSYKNLSKLINFYNMSTI